MRCDKSQRFMKHKHFLLPLVLLCVFLYSCGTTMPLPPYSNQRNCYAVEVAVGPEDFVLDKWHASPRLLISSLDRRDPSKLGDIYYFDLKTGYSSPMPRTGEPKESFVFHPLGMDIRRTQNKTLLYVIIRRKHQDSKENQNGIAIYQVLDKELQFIQFMMEARCLWSPNNISVLKNGDIYVTNDSHGKMELIFGKKSSEIAYFSQKNKKWSIVATDLSFANGILALPERVFVTASRSNKLLEYRRHTDGTLGKGITIAEIKGADNIMPFGTKLLVTGHFNDIAFMRHAQKQEVPSPSVVFLVDPDTGIPEETIKTIYVNDGNQISAASTAFVYKDKLYISQVFGTKIVVCDAVDLNPSS